MKKQEYLIRAWMYSILSFLSFIILYLAQLNIQQFIGVLALFIISTGLSARYTFKFEESK